MEHKLTFIAVGLLLLLGLLWISLPSALPSLGRPGARCGTLAFEDFPAETRFRNAPAPVHWQSFPGADGGGRIAIANEAARGPNFAGAYTVASWDCGSGCGEHAIVDAETGDFVVYGLRSAFGVAYDLGSTLLVVNPPSRVPVGAPYANLTTQYFTLRGRVLVPLCQTALAPTALAPREKAPICIQVITPARDPRTGMVREFPTPCDVPEGWEMGAPDVFR